MTHYGKEQRLPSGVITAQTRTFHPEFRNKTLFPVSPVGNKKKQRINSNKTKTPAEADDK